MLVTGSNEDAHEDAAALSTVSLVRSVAAPELRLCNGSRLRWLQDHSVPTAPSSPQDLLLGPGFASDSTDSRAHLHRSRNQCSHGPCRSTHTAGLARARPKLSARLFESSPVPDLRDL